MKNSITKPINHQQVNIDYLLAGDILLYSASDDLGRDIADSTKGHFSHAAIYVGCSEVGAREILHTGPDGAELVNCDADFNRELHGVFVVRVTSLIDEEKLYELAKEQEGKEYDSGSLKYIGAAALDRRKLDDGSGVYRFIPKKLGETIAKKANRKGSTAVCSGLSLDLLNQATEEEIFPETVVALDQLSPNCIYEEALKNGNKASVYELIPLSEEELSRERKNICLLYTSPSPRD